MELVMVEFSTANDVLYGGSLDFHYVPELQKTPLQMLIDSALLGVPFDEPIFVTTIVTSDPEIVEENGMIHVLDSGDYVVTEETMVYY